MLWLDECEEERANSRHAAATGRRNNCRGDLDVARNRGAVCGKAVLHGLPESSDVCAVFAASRPRDSYFRAARGEMMGYSMTIVVWPSAMALAIRAARSSVVNPRIQPTKRTLFKSTSPPS
jgi:hypothetical protein